MRAAVGQPQEVDGQAGGHRQRDDADLAQYRHVQRDIGDGHQGRPGDRAAGAQVAGVDRLPDRGATLADGFDHDPGLGKFALDETGDLLFLVGHGPMRQFIFDIPQDDFAERCLRDFKGPLKIGAESPVQRLLVRTLGERTRDFLDSPHGEDAERYQEEAYDLLASIISDHAGEHRASALGASYLLAAKQYIQQHLDEPALSCERVAAATGVSSRHLARLFAQEGSSPGRYLQERRLERARQLLASPQGRRLDVAEVAYRHGFSSQAHFARAFKARYGMTPSEARGR